MTWKYWKLLLPPRPEIPARLWLSALVVGLAGASAMFQKELWPYHPKAEQCSYCLLMLAMLFGGLQVLKMLWNWPNADDYAGPTIIWLILRGIVFVIIVGIVMFLLVLSFLMLLFILH